MVRVSRHARHSATNDVLRTDSLEHFSRAFRHVAVDRELVGAPRDIDVERRNPPRIAKSPVEACAILIARERFSEASERHYPRPERRQPLLECGSNPRIARASLPADATRASLILVATNKS